MMMMLKMMAETKTAPKTMTMRSATLEGILSSRSLGTQETSSLQTHIANMSS